MVLDLNNLSINHIQLLNDISKYLKEDFHVLIEQVYKKTDGSVYWLVNSTLSRHTYLTTLFFDLCYLELTKKLLASEKYSKIVVKNSGQKIVLQDHIHKNGYKTIVTSPLKFYKKFKNRLFPYKYFVSNLITAIRQFNLRDNNRKNDIPKDIHLTLIDTFFIPSMFSNGKYCDRYYQGLFQHLPDDHKNKIFFVPTISISRKLKNIISLCEKADEKFIYKFDFLHISDYLRALFSPFTIKKIKFKNIMFRGFNIAPMLKEEFRKNLSNSSSFLAILNYMFFKRLRQSNIKLRFVVDWFENQVIDRGFNKGKNDFYPDVPSIGYQGFLVSYDYNFYLQPTEFELTAGLLPDKIGVVGRGLIDSVKKYCSQLEIVSAPAFRFNNIHQEGIKSDFDNNQSVNILIALPISIKDSVDIMKLVMSAKGNESIKHVKFTIKLHPALNIEKCKAELYEWPNDFDVFHGDFSEAILKSDMLISNSSSTCMESLAYGVPVVVIGSQRGFTQNPIPESIPNYIWELCYTDVELVLAINKFCFESNEFNNEQFRISVSSQIRRDFFEPVNKKNVASFLNL